MKFKSVKIADALANVKQNAIKFSAEKGGKYNVYFPRINGVESKIHEWTKDGQFGSAACLGDSDTCPFCKVEKDGWDKYRDEIDEALAGVDPTDTDTVSKIKRSLVPKITSKKYLYALVAIVIPANKAEGTEESYELKIMKMSEHRLSSFRTYAAETTEDGTLEGATLLLKFGDEDNARDRAKNLTILPGKPISKATIEAIEKEAAEYNWEKNLSSFYEFRDMSESAINDIIVACGGAIGSTVASDEENPFEEKTDKASVKSKNPQGGNEDSDDDGAGDGTDGDSDDDGTDGDLFDII